MGRRFAAIAVSISASLFVAAPAPAADTVPLAWKWEKGAKFALESTKRTHTHTVTKSDAGNQTEDEDETATNDMLAVVEEVAEGGPVRLLLSFRKYDMVQSSAQKSLELHGSWTEDGKPDVRVKFDMAALGPMRREAEQVLHGVATNLLSLKVHVDLSRSGAVLAAKGEGDIFAGIDRSTPMSRVMVATMERLLTTDEFAQSIVGEAFPQLADAPPLPTARWPVKRSFSMMGLAMRGRGAGSVVKSDPAAPEVQHAEETVYEIDSSGFSKMLEAVIAEAAPGAKISASLRPEKSMVVRYSGRFDTAAGHPLEWSTPKLDMKLLGSVTVSMGKVKNTVKLEVGVTGESRCRWTRI
jgi:hypothetical protein